MKNAHLISSNPADKTVAIHFGISCEGHGPIFMYDTEAVAASVFERVRTLLVSEIEVFGYHCSDDTQKRLSDAGHDDTRWTLSFGTLYTCNVELTSSDRGVLEKLAQHLTVPTSVCGDDHKQFAPKALISRYARIRFIYENGEVSMSFTAVPYTNIPVEDWI